MDNSNRPSFKGRRGKQRTVIEKFWDYVITQPETECWKWRGHRDEHGYPRIAPARSRRLENNPHGDRRSPLKGSRVSWEIHNGPIPEGLHVLHHCDNPECTNPKHLYVGTQVENLKDAYRRGRRKPNRLVVDGKVLCPRGHEKVLLPNQTNKYVCRICMASWSKRNPTKHAATQKRRKENACP